MERILKILALALILGACQQRVDLDYNLETKGDMIVEVAFNTVFDGFSTGTLKSYPTDEFEVIKQRIFFDGIRVVFYTPSTSAPNKPDKVAYVFDKDVNAKSGAFSGKDYVPSLSRTQDGVTFGIRGTEKIKAGDYIVYYFTSCNKELKDATAVGQPFSAIEGALSYDKNDFNKNVLKNNLYFSAEPTVLNKSFFDENSVTKVYQLPKAKLTSLNAVVSLVWEKNVKDAQYEILGDEIMFNPDVQNKKYYLFPQMDEQLKSKFQINYPMDPNYTGFSEKGIGELKDQFLYSNYQGEMLGVIASLSDSYQNKYRPVPENTMASKETSANVVTRLILTVPMMPKELVAKLTPEQIEESKKIMKTKIGWVCYKGKNYLSTEFLSMYAEATEAKSPTVEQTQLKEIGSRIMQPASAGQKSQLINEGYYDDEIQYYYLSRCYFAFPITHAKLDDVGGTTSNGGYYGVVRNHHYEFKIKAFATIGKPNPKELSYDVNYLSDRFLSTEYEIGGMTKVVNEIDVVY